MTLAIVLSTCPPQAAAELAHQLVTERLAACCNVLPSVESTYWWEGQVVTDAEAMLVFKTPADRVSALTERLAALHPYDVPEIVALEASRVLEGYLSWAVAATR